MQHAAPDGSWTISTTVLARAAALDDAAFRTAAEAQMRLTIAALGHARNRPVVRIWSFVPEINAASTDGDRYRSFNAGRAAAFASLEPALTPLPAASGVGHAGDALVIHALALEGVVEAIENPRQIPAWRYSRRFGDRPPMFSRGCVVRSSPAPAFLASGTASVVGEDSVHDDDFQGQLRETLQNLRALCAAASFTPSRALRHMRVHLRPCDAAHAAVTREALHDFVPEATLEFVLAPLCRPELAIEIEGCAWEPGA